MDQCQRIVYNYALVLHIVLNNLVHTIAAVSSPDERSTIRPQDNPV